MISYLYSFLFICGILSNCYGNVIQSSDLWIRNHGDAKSCCKPNNIQDEVVVLKMNNTKILTKTNVKIFDADIARFEKKHGHIVTFDKQSVCVFFNAITDIYDLLEISCINVAENGYGSEVLTIKTVIKVYKPAEAIVEPTTTANLGSDFTKECTVRGSPKLSGEWINPSGKALPNPLELTNVNLGMAGTYRCVARIDVPATQNIPSEDLEASSTMLLVVQYKPNLTVAIEDIYTDIGVDEKVEITVKGNPEPKLKCDIINAPIPRTINFQRVGDTDTYSVTLKGVSKDNVGNYSCIATNELGSDSFPIRLRLGPSTPFIFSKNSTEYSDYYQIQWRVNSKASVHNVTIDVQEKSKFNNSFVSVKKPRVVILPTNPIKGLGSSYEKVYSHHVDNLSAGTNHQIHVTACNKHMCSKSQLPVQFKTLDHNNGKNKVDPMVLKRPATASPMGGRSQKQCTGLDCASSKINQSGFLLALISLLQFVIGRHG